MFLIMQKIFYIIPLLLMVASCDWYKFDNMEGYDATIAGKFLDAATNDPIEFGVPDSYAFTVYEENYQPPKGTFAPSAITWYARSNGSYTNKLVFSGDYRLQYAVGNYYPIEERFSIAKGNNVKDFKVTPYARVKDVHFEYDAATKEIVATFKVEHGDASKTNGINVFFMGAPDRFVGKNHNNFTDATASKMWVEPNTTVELRVNTTGGNNSEFKYEQPHFLRIAAMAAHCSIVPAWDEDQGPDMSTFPWDQLAPDFSNWNEVYGPWAATAPHVIVHHDAEYTSDGTVNPNQMYNYSGVWKISADFKTVELVTDWE